MRELLGRVSIEPLEAVWLIINFTTLGLTLSALIDARADRDAVRRLNGQARELAAGGNVRREFLRIVVLLLLISISIPGVFSDREVTLSPPVAALMAIPFVLLASTTLDARDRRAMVALVTADLLKAGTTHLQRIEDKLDANTEISQGANDHAVAAFHEANTVNEKLKSIGLEVIAQGEDAQRDRDAAAEP